MSPATVVELLVGIFVIAHAGVSAVRFKALSAEIARAEDKSARLDEPSADEGGLTPYELDLWDRLAWGPPIDGIDADLTARAVRLGWHLRLTLRLTATFIGAIVIVEMLRL